MNLQDWMDYRRNLLILQDDKRHEATFKLQKTGEIQTYLKDVKPNQTFAIDKEIENVNAIIGALRNFVDSSEIEYTIPSRLNENFILSE